MMRSRFLLLKRQSALSAEDKATVLDPLTFIAPTV